MNESRWVYAMSLMDALPKITDNAYEVEIKKPMVGWSPIDGESIDLSKIREAKNFYKIRYRLSEVLLEAEYIFNRLWRRVNYEKKDFDIVRSVRLGEFFIDGEWVPIEDLSNPKKWQGELPKDACVILEEEHDD